MRSQPTAREKRYRNVEGGRRDAQDTAEQVLTQLRWIKWLMVIVVTSLVLGAGSIVWISSEVASGMSEFEGGSSFTQRAQELLDEGKAEEVIAMSKEREKTHPMDPYVHWHRGKAHFQLRQFDEAMKALQRADEVAPEWREKYTGPYIRRIRDELAKAVR
jgi:tetratricopeptide (TPR) repeat protein